MIKINTENNILPFIVLYLRQGIGLQIIKL